jgi:hypothetical protein
MLRTRKWMNFSLLLAVLCLCLHHQTCFIFPGGLRFNRRSALNVKYETPKDIHEARMNPHPKSRSASHPYVVRPLRWPDRIPLGQVKPGQRYRGLIITILP